MIVRTHHIERFSLAMKTPLRTATGEFHSRDGFVVSLQSGSHEGLGEATPLESFGTESLAEALEAVEAACAWLRERKVPDQQALLDDWLEDCPAFAERPAARNAVETALLDLLAQQLRVPLHRLLDPNARDAVKVNAILPQFEPNALAEAGRRAVDDGFETLKVKVAALPITEDARRIEALRIAVGERIRIRVDANGGWSSTEAARNLETLAAFGLELCEQPVSPRDPFGLLMLRERAPCRIAADEEVRSIFAATTLISERMVDVLVLRPVVLGGLLRTLHLARAAKARGIDSYLASSLDSVIARAAATHLAAAMPDCGLASGLATGALFVNEPDTPFVPVGGRIVLPDTAGLGVELRRAA